MRNWFLSSGNGWLKCSQAVHRGRDQMYIVEQSLLTALRNPESSMAQIISISSLRTSPFCVLTCHENVQDPHSLFQCVQPDLEFFAELSCVRTLSNQCGVEILSIWRSPHSGTECRLHPEAMMWRQGRFVRIAERRCKLLRSASGNIGPKRLSGEVQSSGQP